MPIIAVVIVFAVAIIGIAIAVVGVARSISEERQTEAIANADKEARIAEAIAESKGEVGVQEQKQKGWNKFFDTIMWLGETAIKVVI